jgi:uncharacterized protein (UPF0261 family)/ABC-type branched-subunit amino acid transport system ATPase component
MANHDSWRDDDRDTREERGARSAAALMIRDLHVYYGESHAIQGVELELNSGILSVVGRNGMGKTTLCNTIMGLVEARSGSIRFHNRELRGRRPNVIANMGIGYVPQGRRIWPSLTVDEHLRLASRRSEDASWTIERIYDTFGRLAERRSNGGSQLSGGEQQMLAISRALLANPQLLVMDEPTEGLAPVIVQQVESMLREIARDRDFAVLLIEQNIGVATAVAEQVAIMANGRITRVMDAAELAGDRALQQQLLGVGRHDDGGEHNESAQTPTNDSVAADADPVVYTVANKTPNNSTASGGALAPMLSRAPNRWGTSAGGEQSTEHQDKPLLANTEQRSGAATVSGSGSLKSASVADQIGKTALVVGTFDTKATELQFIRDQLRAMGVLTRTVDLSTTSTTSSRADVRPNDVASCHPQGSSAVFTGDRGSAVAGMTQSFEIWIGRQRDIGGIISAGGSGGTALVSPGMRRLPVGIPKLIISTVASGDVGPYVGPSDITMMHSVTDVQGINSVSRDILRNGASALAGMINALPSTTQRKANLAAAKPAVGITMFGVTTPCVQAVSERLADDMDCLVFHATGTGGRAMENLVDSGSLAAVLDLTTTELADMQVGGVFAATEDRMGAIIRTRVPYVGSVGALDMVNFAAMDTVPAQFRERNLYEHNPNVTLMRTTVEENRSLGQWIARRLNQMSGPVRFLLPEGGVSLLDMPNQPFHDPQATGALFEAIEAGFETTGNRRLVRVPANINDPEFVDHVIEQFGQIYQPASQLRSA